VEEQFGVRRLLIIVFAFAAVSSPSAADQADRCNEPINDGDDAAAIKCLQPLADAGNAKAEMLLASVYGTVNLPAHDPDKSAYWTRKAAERGDVDAQLSAGYLYRQGEGVPKDLTESLRWFRAAADHGSQIAENELARVYLNGMGTAKDPAQALAWERKAAEQRGPLTALAEGSVGSMYMKGDGALQNYAEAARWFRRSAEHGFPNSYLMLAQLDEKGLAGAPDPFEAYVGYSVVLAWLQSQDGHAYITDEVAKRRDAVAAKLTSAQRVRADDLARQGQRTIH
jgi:TPR repeat protein